MCTIEKKRLTESKCGPMAIDHNDIAKLSIPKILHNNQFNWQHYSSSTCVNHDIFGSHEQSLQRALEMRVYNSLLNGHKWTRIYSGEMKINEDCWEHLNWMINWLPINHLCQ